MQPPSFGSETRRPLADDSFYLPASAKAKLRANPDLLLKLGFLGSQINARVDHRRSWRWQPFALVFDYSNGVGSEPDAPELFRELTSPDKSPSGFMRDPHFSRPVS
jgi:hypothetical protein